MKDNDRNTCYEINEIKCEHSHTHLSSTLVKCCRQTNSRFSQKHKLLLFLGISYCCYRQIKRELNARTASRGDKSLSPGSSSLSTVLSLPLHLILVSSDNSPDNRPNVFQGQKRKVMEACILDMGYDSITMITSLVLRAIYPIISIFPETHKKKMNH